MKIGLITIYHVPNYGSVLQAYATQTVLEEMGHECKIIRYAYPNEWHYSKGVARPNKLKAMLRRIGLKAQHRKTNILEKFRINNYKFTKEFISLDNLKAEDWSNYDLFVSGSDQLWNTRYTLGDSAFLLSFVPDNKRRISIASSFALKELPVDNVDKYKRELSKFSALSVRESNGIDIINKQLGINKDVFVCLDPTLLLSKEDWLQKLPTTMCRRRWNRPYILLYMWTYAFEPRPYIFEVVKYFQQKLNCDVLALEGYCKPKQAGGLKMRCVEDSNMSEFIDLFANASLVITSSFHGTAYALNFSRPLISIVPDNDGDDRQSSLLRSVGAESCQLKVGDPIENANPYYDKETEQQMLDRLREDSLKWIENAIK